jgi:hypothetical protein
VQTQGFVQKHIIAPGGIGSNPTPDLTKLQNVVDRMVWGADILPLPQRMFFAEKCFDTGEG